MLVDVILLFVVCFERKYLFVAVYIDEGEEDHGGSEGSNVHTLHELAASAHD